MRDLSRHALVVVDVQDGFREHAWGRRNNPECEPNIARLEAHWRAQGWPVVHVRHDSTSPSSPLAPSSPGNRLQAFLAPTADLLVTKSVNSSFHGTPSLEDWLRARGLIGLVVCGITTNHCCETTARVGRNLGFDVFFALDATYTFDRSGPDGQTMRADELARATATNLHEEFATVVSTSDLVGE